MLAASVIPGCEVEIASDASPDTRNYRVDCSRFEEVVGFRAAWDVARGAAELRDAFRAVGLTHGEVEGPRFQRIAQIQELIEGGSLSQDLRYRVPVD
jgi:hypothetical protein